uniref:ATP synthase F0 subunit 8 n=1 Tax=Cissites auriculata TaxID=1288037 RepID=UPI001FA728B6|nr:ATP synthase F0 subunit 8 [Cissites auriculata]UMR54824.1 ATP synthase F0 subunit 8 [Cissites auriculata]
MPQMAPLNWLSLLFFFITIFLLINSMNFYCLLHKSNSKTFKKNKISSNWKWL